MIENLGLRIKTLRTQKGISQTELAKNLNVTSSLISAYELSERTPSLELLVKLCKYFNVTSDYLLGINHQSPINFDGIAPADMQAIITIINSLKSKN